MKSEHIKQTLNRPVMYKGREYLMVRSAISKIDNEYYYQAELRDLKADFSVIWVKLEDVEEIVDNA